jgi:hypothetical protein
MDAASVPISAFIVMPYSCLGFDSMDEEADSTREKRISHSSKCCQNYFNVRMIRDGTPVFQGLSQYCVVPGSVWPVLVRQGLYADIE